MVTESPGKIVWAELVSAAILILDLKRDISEENSPNENGYVGAILVIALVVIGTVVCTGKYKIQGEYKIRPYGVMTEEKCREKDWAELQNFCEAIIFISDRP